MSRSLIKTVAMISSSLLLQACLVSVSSSINSSISSLMTSLGQSSSTSITVTSNSSTQSSSEDDLYWCIHTGTWTTLENCQISSSSAVISSIGSSINITSSDSFIEVSSSIASSIIISSSFSSSFQNSSSYISSVALELPAFYDNASGLTGNTLKAALNDLIDYHVTYPYTSSSTDVWDILKVTDEDLNNPNNVIGIYTLRSIPKSWQDGSSTLCTNDCWNREHVWSKSHGDFGETQGPGTDVHHLRAADRTVNSSKGNLDFDLIVPHINGASGNQVDDLHNDGSRTYIEAWSANNAFEPADSVKGDIARMIMYMDIRYDGTEGYPDLTIVDAVNTDAGSYSEGSTNGYYGKLSTLLRWNEEDPVDDYERQRHEKIVGFQGNRNPFVDFPQFANLIWK